MTITRAAHDMLACIQAYGDLHTRFVRYDLMLAHIADHYGHSPNSDVGLTYQDTLDLAHSRLVPLWFQMPFQYTLIVTADGFLTDTAVPHIKCNPGHSWTRTMPLHKGPLASYGPQVPALVRTHAIDPDGRFTPGFDHTGEHGGYETLWITRWFTLGMAVGQLLARAEAKVL